MPLHPQAARAIQMAGDLPTNLSPVELRRAYTEQRIKMLPPAPAVAVIEGLSVPSASASIPGQLAVGKYADVCIFDAAAIRDSATFEQPTRPALGIHYVLVNGNVALANGVPSATRAGMVLLRQDVRDSS
jgi:N-acyl-D-aspartate/D-glutamate deacylase